MAVALMAAGTCLTTASAATLPPYQLIARPLTPGEISKYGLPSGTEASGGLATVGVGQPVYLEADVPLGATNVLSVNWTLAHRPILSSATLTNSPLGANVPVYEPSDKLVYQVGSRMLLRPDVNGYTTSDQYIVTATITTTTGTNNLTITITAGTYLGVGLLPNTYGCALCHSGGENQVAPDKVTPWMTTEHASMFARGIDGLISSHYSVSCLPCHTVGYDTNASALNNGGFYGVWKTTSWMFPTNIANTNLAAGNWTSMETNYPGLANVANIQCENCHGAGSQHGSGLGNTNFISVSYNSGVCAQCHDDPPGHIDAAEWDNSIHAVTTTDPAGSASCVGCHTGKGFIARMQGATITDTSYNPINCMACHDPHGETSPTNNLHLIRAMTSVTLMDGTVVTNAGEGLLCMQCHHARAEASTSAMVYSGHFGPHHGPQADMLEGANGYTYGLTIPSSAHAGAVSNTCVACHMQTETFAQTDPAYLHAGGHTFEVAYSNEDMVSICEQCHGTMTSFDFPVEDFDGSGVTQGVQTQVQSLLNEVAMLLPGGAANVASNTVTPAANWTVPQLEAAYNYLFVQSDGSLGVHNTAYAAGLLQASIANLTGVSVPGGLPDAWVVQYFGSITNPAAAPNAINNSNGMPNWMMYALGLNPTQSGVTLTNGVVYNDVTALGGTNVVQIYTAAEVVFNTQVGQTYQIQSIGSLSGGWQNVGSPIAGTGQDISFLTPTRYNVQQFFRVVTTTTP
ncbi:MAG: hypothetical protein ACLQSR_11640 [Limisphaerales bacterium]